MHGRKRSAVRLFLLLKLLKMANCMLCISLQFKKYRMQ